MYLMSFTGLRSPSKNTRWINSKKPTVLIKKLYGQCNIGFFSAEILMLNICSADCKARSSLSTQSTY